MTKRHSETFFVKAKQPNNGAKEAAELEARLPPGHRVVPMSRYFFDVCGPDGQKLYNGVPTEEEMIAVLKKLGVPPQDMKKAVNREVELGICWTGMNVVVPASDQRYDCWEADYNIKLCVLP